MGNVLDGIRDHPKPADGGKWWSQQSLRVMAAPLDDEEQGYFDFFSSGEGVKALRIREPADLSNLNADERQRATERFGKGPEAFLLFVNFDNRRRIVAHY